MALYLNTCGNILAGGTVYFPIVGVEKLKIDSITHVARQFFGASMGVLAYQAIALTGSPFLLANRVVVSLTVAAAGLLIVKMAAKDAKNSAHHLTAILLIVTFSNAILGAAAIYQGRYDYGFSALAFTVAQFS